MAADAPLGRERRQVLGVVEQGDGVEVGAETEHSAAGPDESFERGSGPVVVVPWHVVEQPGGERPGRCEPPLRVIADLRAGSRPEHLGEHADVGFGRGDEAIERLRPTQQVEAFVFGPFVDPRPVVAGAQRDEQRPARPNGSFDRVDDAIGSSHYRSDGAQRHVHHQYVARDDTETVQVGGELLDRLRVSWRVRRHGPPLPVDRPRSGRRHGCRRTRRPHRPRPAVRARAKGSRRG